MEGLILFGKWFKKNTDYSKQEAHTKIDELEAKEESEKEDNLIDEAKNDIVENTVENAVRFVDEYEIGKIYNELVNTFSRQSQVYEEFAISTMHNPNCFYKAIEKYENVRWNGCELDRVSLFSYRTTYSDMNETQFAYYIYWRTKALSGEVLYCELSYFYVYVYELLAGFHSKSLEEGYQLLINVYLSYRRFDKKIDRYLPNWLLAYCIIHGIYDEKKAELEGFLNIDNKMQLAREKVLNNDYSSCFDIVMSSSAYKMNKYSKFYMGRKDAKIIDLVFDDAMSAINECMYEHNLILSEFMVGKAGKAKWVLLQATPWENNVGLFSRGIKYNRTFTYGGITYEYNMSEKTWYYDMICEYGKITGGQDNPKAGYRYHNGEFIAFLVRTIEDVCRKKAQYPHAMRPAYKSVYGTKRLNELAESGKIRQVVEKVVDEYVEHTKFEFVEIPVKKPTVAVSEKKIKKPIVKSVEEVLSSVELIKMDFAKDIHDYIASINYFNRENIAYIEPQTNITRFKKSEQDYVELLNRIPKYRGNYETDGLILEHFLKSSSSGDIRVLEKITNEDFGYALWVDLITKGIITYPLSSVYALIFMHQVGNRDDIASKEWTLAVMVQLWNHYYPEFQHEEVLMWIRDYWITYCKDISYPEFKAMFKYDIHFEGDEIQEAVNAIDTEPLENYDYLEFFSTNADYRMNKARTVLEGNGELLGKCLRETVEKLKVLFAKRGLVWDEFLQEADYEIAEKRRDPFRRMIISYDTLFKIAETFNGREITEYEDYSIEFDRVKKDMKYLIRRKRKTYWKSRYFVECIGKLCELHLRNWLGVDASFKVDLDKLCSYFPQLAIVVEDDSLMDTINTAVESICVRNNIEKSADSKDSIEHMINYHDDSKIAVDDAKSEFESAMLYKKISAAEIEKARQVLISNQEKLIVEDEIEEVVAISEEIQTTVYSEVQIRILKLLLDKEYSAMETYVMQVGCNLVLEVEKINEIAMEDLGDILIDNDGSNYFVYEDYADYIEGL